MRAAYKTRREPSRSVGRVLPSLYVAADDLPAAEGGDAHAAQDRDHEDARLGIRKREVRL